MEILKQMRESIWSSVMYWDLECFWEQRVSHWNVRLRLWLRRRVCVKCMVHIWNLNKAISVLKKANVSIYAFSEDKHLTSGVLRADYLYLGNKTFCNLRSPIGDASRSGAPKWCFWWGYRAGIKYRWCSIAQTLSIFICKWGLSRSLKVCVLEVHLIGKMAFCSQVPGPHWL